MKAVLDIVLTLVLIAFGGFGIYASIELVRTSRSMRAFTEELSRTVPPLVQDATVSVQAVNLELMRLDDILDSVQHVSDTVADTTRAAEQAAKVPAAKFAEYAEKVRRFIVAMRER